MFLGKYSHTIDSKGRLIIPAKYRDEIGDQKLVVVPWWEGDLTVFTQDGFRDYIKSLDELQGSAESRRRIRRFITSGADECRLDAQGRILLNQNLRNYAHLSGNVILTGNMDSFEIWNPDVWAKTEDLLNDAEEMRNELESLRQML
ncbi:MAG: division/cell wall cluster transcriptional repressor MraZ [Lachnospiraceae bacterium]|nr:division/cell wall cluster transcriptional repressor MraZ [Lachnospiraceae bacterium]